MTRSVFEKLNQALEKADKRPFSNPRNAAAGSLRQKDPSVTRARRLSFYAYQLIGIDPSAALLTQKAVWEQLKAWGFCVSEEAKLAFGADQVQQQYMALQDQRESLPFAIDGMVVKLNDFELQRKYGVGSRAPKWAVAYKFPSQVAITTLSSIAFQVGRRGVLTPWLQEKGVHAGDTVAIQRAGEVIPQLVSVVAPTGRGSLEIPTHCPACSQRLLWNERDLVCAAGWQCPAQRLAWFSQFVSSAGFDIQGLGIRCLTMLVERKLLRGPVDLFRLQPEDLSPLPGFGARSAARLVEAIQASKGISLERWLVALGIPWVGKEMAWQLSKHFLTWERLQRASLVELLAVDSIGPVTANALLSFFVDPLFSAMCAELLRPAIGIRIAVYSPVESAASLPLQGKKVVITGSFEETREQVKKILQELGATVVSQISAQSDYLLCGDAPGSKVGRARALEVTVVDRAWLRQQQASVALSR